MIRKIFLCLLVALAVTPYLWGQSSATKRVAILETIDREDKVSYGVKLMVRSKLCAVITATPGYEGYDRVDVASIVSEHNFQRTGLVSDADIKRLGEMIGANYVLLAEVAYLDGTHVFIVAKILDVETAQVMQTADVQSLSTADELEKNCRTLAAKLLNVNVETGAVKGELTVGKSRYVGEYLNGKPHGKGVKYYAEDSEMKLYEGTWVSGRREGTGTLIWKNGAKYEGAWRNDKRNGYGIMYYPNGDIYKGNWVDGKKHGKGTMTFSPNDSVNRKYYSGDWLEGIRQGEGTMEWVDGDKYVGSFKNGKMCGKGTYYWTNGCYEESYRNESGIETGQATYHYEDGIHIMKGLYVNGKKDGHWRHYKNGEYVYTWVYHNGRLGRTIWP